MAGLVPAIHVFDSAPNVDARIKSAHDEKDGALPSRHSAGIGVAGAVGAVAACDGAMGPSAAVLPWKSETPCRKTAPARRRGTRNGTHRRAPAPTPCAPAFPPTFRRRHQARRARLLRAPQPPAPRTVRGKNWRHRLQRPSASVTPRSACTPWKRETPCRAQQPMISSSSSTSTVGIEPARSPAAPATRSRSRARPATCACSARHASSAAR